MSDGPVLVTGARGFLGRHLCRRLRERGAEVHAVSRVAVSEAGARWWQADLADLAATRELMAQAKPHTIVHLAGRVSAAPSLDLVEPTFASLLASTVNLLTAATESGCGRVVLVGSREEPAGAGPDAVPASPYGAAKWAASVYGRMFHRLYGTPVALVRLFMTYGPGQARDKVIPSTILSLLRGQAPRVSRGERPLDWIHVDDAVDGLLRIAGAPGVDGATTDLGTGRGTPLRAVIRQLTALVNPAIQPVFGAVPDRPDAGADVADVAATAARLGWRPAISLEDGLARTVQWYRREVDSP